VAGFIGGSGSVGDVVGGGGMEAAAFKDGGEKLTRR
jgi:hypothetical protein